MAIFEHLGRRITDAGQGVARQTRNFADVTRLNSAISDKEWQITRLYEALGRACYEVQRGSPAPEYREAVEKINSLFAEIAQHQEEIK